MEQPLGENKNAVEFDANQISFPLLIRTFNPGDRFHPQGGAGSGKIKKFFINEKMDRETRHTVPLVAGEDILWVMGIRRCAGKQVDSESGRVLRMESLKRCR